MSTRTAKKLNKTLNDYLKRYEVFYENAHWEIRESLLGGLGVFATRDIDAGELIFRDYPVILGPRCAEGSPKICVICFSRINLKNCKNCALPVCSDICQNSARHLRECKLIRQMKNEVVGENETQKLFRCLTPIRSLLLSENDKEVVKILKSHSGQHHGYEVDVLTNELLFEIKEDDKYFLKFVCSVLDANAFEVITGEEENQSSLRGLYPLGSLGNHRCFPNVIHVFDEKQRMVVRAAVFIQKGTELFHSYSRIIWSTTTRLYHLLKTKHFLCKCERCRDPTEFGTYMNAVYCKKCKGKVIPRNPLKSGTNWQCEDCKNVLPVSEVGNIMSLLGSVVRGFDETDLNIMLKFIFGKLVTVVPETNQVVVELKYKIIWILGYHKNFTWTELPTHLLCIKKKFCEDILELLEKLRNGQCKMRGLLLFELYECLKEIRSRECKSVDMYGQQTENKFLEESANILMYDVSAPEAVKGKWKVE